MTYTVYENKILRNNKLFFAIFIPYKSGIKVRSITLLICKLLNAAEGIGMDIDTDTDKNTAG